MLANFNLASSIQYGSLADHAPLIDFQLPWRAYLESVIEQHSFADLGSA